jgi:uncharacterized protein YijF (DUF1287 family)
VNFKDYATTRARALADAAQQQVGVMKHTDGSYVEIAYPGGDVPQDRGACCDLVVRAFREVGIDLQVKVHEDMQAHFILYPHRWGLLKPDSNIDHRRVPNLGTYFKRSGAALPVTSDSSDYWPGDVVTWQMKGGPHIGIVSTVPTDEGTRYRVTHFLAGSVRVEDDLFRWKITGHFRPL